VTLNDLEANRQRMINDPAFHPAFDQLGDCRDVTESRLTADQIRQFVMHATFSRTSRRAIVSRKSSAAFGVGRMFEIHREASGGEEVRVFRDIEQAEEWLGLRKT
jgi:hypothetical protein